jgi:hypothetical protein
MVRRGIVVPEYEEVSEGGGAEEAAVIGPPPIEKTQPAQ